MKNLSFRLVTFFLHVKPNLHVKPDLVSGYSENIVNLF